MSEADRPWRDPLVAEVRRIREDLFAAAGHDIHEFCRRLREKQARSGHRVSRARPVRKQARRAKPREPDLPCELSNITLQRIGARVARPAR